MRCLNFLNGTLYVANLTISSKAVALLNKASKLVCKPAHDLANMINSRIDGIFLDSLHISIASLLVVNRNSISPCPTFSIQTSILNCFSQMLRFDLITECQICYCPGNLEDTIICSCGKIQFFHGRL